MVAIKGHDREISLVDIVVLCVRIEPFVCATLLVCRIATSPLIGRAGCIMRKSLKPLGFAM